MAKKQGSKNNQSDKREKPSIPFAGKAIKAKAFLTDVFMLLMPFFYLTIYFVFDGLKDVASHRLEAWIYAIIPFLVILTIFMFKDEGRTPGARSQGLKVIEFHSLKSPSLFSIIFRNLTLVLTLVVPFFWLIPFFRQDARSLHDLLSATCVIVDANPPQNKMSEKS